MTPFKFRKNDIIGNLEAETDTFLDDCFIETEAYNALRNFDRDHHDYFKRIINEVNKDPLRQAKNCSDLSGLFAIS